MLYDDTLDREHNREDTDMIHLFSHNDLDGKSCGYLAQLAFGDNCKISYCSHGTINDRVEMLLDNPKERKTEIIITDIAVNEELMMRLDERSNAGGKVKLIDHHATALHFNGFDWGHVQVRYDDDRLTCATSLFYEYLIENNKLKPTGALNEYVELVRLYDTWEWFDKKVEAKRLNDLFFILPPDKFEDQIMDRLKGDSFQFSETETTILDLEEENIADYIKKKQRQMVEIWDTWSLGEGSEEKTYKIGILHAERYHSELGNEINRENPHLDLIVILNISNKRIGLRTIHDEVDCSIYAKQYGGGGHPKASGGNMTSEAFEKFVVAAFHEQPRRIDAPKNEHNVKENPDGSLYVNNHREVSKIYSEDNQTWVITHKTHPVEETFESYQDAENYVKRHFEGWLMRDDEANNNN